MTVVWDVNVEPNGDCPGTHVMISEAPRKWRLLAWRRRGGSRWQRGMPMLMLVAPSNCIATQVHLVTR
jgi:hypothetical protein